MPTTRLNFARAILHRAGYQRGREYQMALVAVMTSEGSEAWWNPLDTTRYVGGSTAYNSFGPNGTYHVWNYPDAPTGVWQTILTLEQPNMRYFDVAMRRPHQSAEVLIASFERTPWQPPGDTLSRLLVSDWRANRRAYREACKGLVAGHGPWPYRRNGVRR